MSPYQSTSIFKNVTHFSLLSKLNNIKRIFSQYNKERRMKLY